MKPGEGSVEQTVHSRHRLSLDTCRLEVGGYGRLKSALLPEEFPPYQLHYPYPLATWNFARVISMVFEFTPSGVTSSRRDFGSDLAANQIDAFNERFAGGWDVVDLLDDQVRPGVRLGMPGSSAQHS